MYLCMGSVKLPESDPGRLAREAPRAVPALSDGREPPSWGGAGYSAHSLGQMNSMGAGQRSNASNPTLPRRVPPT